MESVYELTTLEDTFLIQWQRGRKVASEEEERHVLAMIDELDAALDISPAIKSEELTMAAKAFGQIVTPEDRINIGLLRAEIVKAEKHVETCTDDGIALWHAKHKAKKAHQTALLEPLRNARAMLDQAINADRIEQARIVEEERQRKQNEADEKARAEQQERERIARIEQERATAERKRIDAEEKERRRLADIEIAKANENAANAKSKAAQEKAALALRAAQEKAENERFKAMAEKRIAQENEARAKAAAMEAQSVVIVAPIIERQEVEKVAGTRTIKAKYFARVVDIKLVPEMYLLPREPNMKMLNGAAPTYAQTGMKIAGVEFYLDQGNIATKGR